MTEFLNIHPTQLISDELPIPVWRISYSYTTARGNRKDGNRYYIGDNYDWDKIESIFYNYIEEFNNNHPDRKLSNVEILDTTFLGKVYLDLD